MKTSTEKRLFNYLLTFKRGIIIGLICLIIAVALELVGPLIAKTIIDHHILGVEGLWYEVLEEDKYTATYEGKTYKRRDRLAFNDAKGEQITILQVDKNYYIVHDRVPLQGERRIEENTLSVHSGGDEQSFTAKKLSLTDIYPFFKPEQKPIMLLLGLYVVLLFIAGIFQ